MTRRVIALILGLTALGLVTSLMIFTKEAGIEVERAEEGIASSESTLTVLIAATSSGEIRVDGQPVDRAALADEMARIIASAEEASLPDPSFVITMDPDADNAVIVYIMEALARAQATSVSLDSRESE